jgi:hypothetical protein
MSKKAALIIAAGVALGVFCGCGGFSKRVPVFEKRPQAATWINGHLRQILPVSLNDAVGAAGKSLEKLGCQIVKAAISAHVSEVMGIYPDGRQIVINIHPVGPQESEIEVRVGAVGDVRVSRKILKKIMWYLGY